MVAVRTVQSANSHSRHVDSPCWDHNLIVVDSPCWDHNLIVIGKPGHFVDGFFCVLQYAYTEFWHCWPGVSTLWTAFFAFCSRRYCFSYRRFTLSLRSISTQPVTAWRFVRPHKSDERLSIAVYVPVFCWSFVVGSSVGVDLFLLCLLFPPCHVFFPECISYFPQITLHLL